ncbi:hypothetical protein H4R34_000184 [Dimargaris verticillata]|uniref:NADH-ubiquinone oxidoreductase B15 subunit n=1 Tax=Dimargaris verticillata TaxID=2761393 RepID=A0A9W8BCF0_9FUNG|nr:hypothetical protein H4R34_000184 [Dimargaris verticillata]
MGSNDMLRKDPAFERWMSMRENAHRHFRPNPRNMRTAFICFVAVPIIGFFLADKTALKMDAFARKYDESIWVEEQKKAERKKD